MALVVAAVGALPLLSCGQRALVLLDVRASGAFTDPTVLQDVRLTVVANHEVTTRYPRIRLPTSSSYQIGMYLPSDMTGTVSFEATIDDGRCIIGAGTAVASGVQSGETTAAIPILIAPTMDCGNIDGGTAGTGGTGTPGTAGAGGMTGGAGTTGMAGSSPGTGGTGGTGATAGVGGTGGSGGSGGTTGAAGRGGTTGGAGLSGAAGTTGAAGRGGTTGTAGIGGTTGTGGVSGVAGTTGAGGRGGTSGTGGVSGVAGTTGAGGIGGVTGTAGRGGSTGAGGIAGVGGGGPGVGGVGGGGPGIGGTGPGPGVGGSGVAGTTGLGGIGVAGTGGGLCGSGTCLPPWMCDANGQCVCSETLAQVCARAGIQCGYVFDNCNNLQFCSCPIVGTICDTQTNKCMSGCSTGTGGIVTADIICPVSTN